jgi:hypothetical protein
VADQCNDGTLEGGQGLVEAQLAARCFRVRPQALVAITWVEVAKVTWGCQPIQVQPHSGPESPVSSSYPEPPWPSWLAPPG